MNATTIDRRESIGSPSRLFVALELSRSTWRLACSTGPGHAPREGRIRSGCADALHAELRRAKIRFGLPADAPVSSCYEAGRDGFWVARWLARLGIDNVVVESSSIEVPRQARRAKTDRIDARKLLLLLMRYAGGEGSVWKVVHVPSEAAEDRRHLSRLLLAVKRERTRVINRIRGLLAIQGVTVSRTWSRFDVRRILRWDGQPLPPGLQQRLSWDADQLRQLTAQIRALEVQQRAAIRDGDARVSVQARQLARLRGIGSNSAWLYATEIFSWRQIRNGRQLGALSGLAPVPFQSGTLRYDRGLAKTGNRHWRAMAVELAWGWLRHQPCSALSRWYAARFATGGGRTRRVGIAALARKLLVTLWRYLETGVVPTGAALKTA